jgi:AcrR family transcriptional regulator
VQVRKAAGRPRDEGLTDSILNVALEAYVDLGWSGFNLDVVAKRAGAGKAALYARWSGREALIYDVVARVYADFKPTGSNLRENLIALGHHVLDVHADYLRSAVLWTRLRADLATHGGIFERIDREIIQHRQSVYRTIVKHAVATGELPDGGSPMIILDMFAGGLINYLLYAPAGTSGLLKHGKSGLIERFAAGAIAAVKGLAAPKA